MHRVMPLFFHPMMPTIGSETWGLRKICKVAFKSRYLRLVPGLQATSGLQREGLLPGL